MIFCVTLTSPPGQPTGHPNPDLNILLLVEVGHVLLHRATAQLLGLGRKDYSGRAERRLSFLMIVMMKMMDMTGRTGMDENYLCDSESARCLSAVLRLGRTMRGATNLKERDFLFSSFLYFLTDTKVHLWRHCTPHTTPPSHHSSLPIPSSCCSILSTFVKNIFLYTTTSITFKGSQRSKQSTMQNYLWGTNAKFQSAKV